MDVPVAVSVRTGTVHRALADGTVVALDVPSGAAYHLDASAARLWHLVVGTVNVDELVRTATEGHDDPEVRDHVVRFVLDGIAAGLLEGGA